MRLRLSESSKSKEYSGNSIKKAAETIADIFTDFSDNMKSVGIDFAEFFEIFDDYNLGVNSNPIDFIRNVNQMLKNAISEYSEKVKSGEFDRIYINFSIFASISKKAYDVLDKCGLKGYSNIKCNICEIEISGNEGSSDIESIIVHSFG